MNDTTPVTRAPAQRWQNKALWIVGLGLLANAAAMYYARHGEFTLDSRAFAQIPPPAMLGARGVYMAPAQIGPNTFGVYLLDVDSSTITVYRTNPENARLRLACVRSFRYDRFLEDYNNDTVSPSPKQVQKLVEDQRKRLDIENKTGEPTVDQNSKPDENKPDGK